MVGAIWLHEWSKNAPKGPYVARNMRVVRSLPRISGAKLARSDSIGHPNGIADNGWPYGGYTTTADFALTASAPTTNCVRVISFYGRWLLAHGWNQPAAPGYWRHAIGGPSLSLSCAEGPPLTYGISVDYKG